MKYKPEEIIDIFVRQNWETREEAIKKISKHKEILKKYYRAAIKNKLKNWKNTTKGKLGLIIIYDQVPRFIFDEKDPRTYNTDKLAQEITTEMLNSSEYKNLSPIEIMFVFLPYLHFENLEHQKIANRIFKELYKKEPKLFGWIFRASNEYLKIIKKFGRFPHRDKILKR